MYEMIDRYILDLIRKSTPETTAWNVEKFRYRQPGNWNYIDGCMLMALAMMTEITGDDQYMEFAAKVMDHYVTPEGGILTFAPEKRQLDDYNEGRMLFRMLQRTGEEKYRKAARMLHECLMQQPRTAEGNFWHKQIYPNQVWLDGIYMAMPFELQYQKQLGDQNYDDILRQVRTVVQRMRDEKTGLYYHGYDASRTAFWADPETGLSRNFWLRSIGWFSIALVDLIGGLPADHPGRRELAEVFRDLMAAMARFRDAESGMYWQVVDQGGREGNYLELSGSSMVANAMLKGVRLGVLEDTYRTLGRETFDGLVNRCMEIRDGQPELTQICLVAGLGPEDNRRRDGSYEYYISEPVVSNDAKGIAPFVLCYTEIKRIERGKGD